ncbi:MAG: hypothetical protein ACXVCE_10840 [Bacteriovorax sp.]
MTSSHYSGRFKLEILGYLKILRPVHEGMYFPMKPMVFLQLQNTYVQEQEPSASLSFYVVGLLVFDAAPRLLPVSDHS